LGKEKTIKRINYALNLLENKFKIFVGLVIILIIPLWSLKAQQDNLVNQAIQTETNEIDNLKEQIQQKQQEIENYKKKLNSIGHL